MANTPNLDLEKPARGTLNWDTPLNSNMDKIDTVIVDHEAAANPHPTYLTQSEGDALYHGFDASTNDVASRLLVTPGADDQNAISVKIPNSTWGVSQAYGKGQAFEIIEEGAADVDDQSAAGSVIARIDRYGSFGTSGGLHIASGLRSAPPSFTQMMWLQPFVDIYGIVYDQLAAQASSFLLVRRSDATKALEVFGNAGIGAHWWYANDGTTPAAIIGAGDTGSTGARALFRSIGTTVTPLTLRAAVGQSVNILSVLDGAGTSVPVRINKDGYLAIRRTSAPADADVVTSELMFWFDNTPGSAKLMVKAKNSSGTVVSGSVALS